MEVIKMEAPVATGSGKGRTSNINSNESYAVETRNTEVAAISDSLEKEGIQHQIGETADGSHFIQVNEKLALMNEFFYNTCIKTKEWKIRFMVDGKYTKHFKATNLTKIVEVTKSYLA